MAFIKRLLVFLLIIILLGALAYYYPYLTGEVVKDNNTEYEKENVFVNRIIDGDTIVVSGDKIGSNVHVRLLGINTPEKNMPYSNDGVYFLKRIENKSIELLRDKEDEDKYNRKLRYLFYENRFLNLEILEQGFATSFMLDELKYEKELINAENSAKNNKLGLWKESREICEGCIKLMELNAEKEYFIIKNECNFYCNLSKWVVKDDANHFFYLKDLQAFESRTYNSDVDEVKKTNEVWNNAGDRFFMRDGGGELVVFYEYQA